METIKQLLELLALNGGKIVCTAQLDVSEINQARASNRLYVDENGIGYVWDPNILFFPRNEKEIDDFERWYPLDEPLPEKLKDPSFLFNKSDVYGHCPHGENMVTCQTCNPHL